MQDHQANGGIFAVILIIGLCQMHISEDQTTEPKKGDQTYDAINVNQSKKRECKWKGFFSEGDLSQCHHTSPVGRSHIL